LDIGCAVPELACTGDQRADRRGLHQRGRAAAEEHGLDPPVRSLARGMLELGEQGAPPARLVDALAHVAVEVAIGALGFAERPVDVDAQGSPVHRKQASTSLVKARPRWLMAFFSAADISALVRVSPSGWKQGS